MWILRTEENQLELCEAVVHPTSTWRTPGSHDDEKRR